MIGAEVTPVEFHEKNLGSKMSTTRKISVQELGSNAKEHKLNIIRQTKGRTTKDGKITEPRRIISSATVKAFRKYLDAAVKASGEDSSASFHFIQKVAGVPVNLVFPIATLENEETVADLLAFLLKKLPTASKSKYKNLVLDEENLYSVADLDSEPFVAMEKKTTVAADNKKYSTSTKATIELIKALAKENVRTDVDFKRAEKRVLIQSTAYEYLMASHAKLQNSDNHGKLIFVSKNDRKFRTRVAERGEKSEYFSVDLPTIYDADSEEAIDNLTIHATEANAEAIADFLEAVNSELPDEYKIDGEFIETVRSEGADFVTQMEATRKEDAKRTKANKNKSGTGTQKKKNRR